MKSFYQNWILDYELPLVIHHGHNLTFYAHYHSEIEFIYVESGSILVGVNEEKRLLTQGDMVICCSNDIHHFESKEDSQVIILIFKPEMISLSVNWPNDFSFVSPFMPGRPCIQAYQAAAVRHNGGKRKRQTRSSNVHQSPSARIMRNAAEKLAVP